MQISRLRKRAGYTLLGIGAGGATLLILLCVWWWKTPPELARLLPESDAAVYVNVKPLRAATHFDRPGVTRSPSYQAFIDGTGIVPERDLDAAAFALHRMSDPSGPNGTVGYSEVFAGRFDTGRLTRFLAGLAAGSELYAGKTIYAIPSEGRTLRVAVLRPGLVAASNMPTAEQIHSMLDHAWAGFASGSVLLGARYGDVPAFSSAWAVGTIALPFAEDGWVSPLGLRLPLRADATLVASLRFQGAVRLRVEEIASGESEAERSAEALTQMLGLFRALGMAKQPVARTDNERALRELLDSVKIEQTGDRAWLTATVPAEALRQLGQQ